MTDVDKVAFAVGWYELRQCPGCFSPLEDVAGEGDGHTTAGRSFTGGHHPQGCAWSADDLASLVLIGSGIVKYDRGTAGTNRPAVGETAPSRENFPDPGCFVDLPLSGRGPT